MVCIICQIYLDFHLRDEGSSYLKGAACECVKTTIYKKCLSNIFNYFLKDKVLKSSTVILLGGGGGEREGGGGGPQTSFSRNFLNLLKWEIYRGLLH